jgi:branched-chain amino acid transport system substrate-binding protein
LIQGNWTSGASNTIGQQVFEDPLMPPLLPRLLAAALFTSLSWAAAADGVTSSQLVIGQSISLQGGKNDYGAAVLSGMQAYLESVNARGGVHGRRVVLKTIDDDARPERAEANARQLITQDKVFLLFGAVEGGPSTAVMKVASESRVPFFGPVAGAPALRRPHQPLVFPVRAEHRDEFHALLEYARKTGNQRVAFMRADSETGLQHLENLKAICKELGLELVADLPYKPDSSEAHLGQLASRLAASNAQVVVNHGNPSMYEQLIRKARSQGVKASFKGVNSGSAQMAARLGELAHGMVFAQVVPSPWERKTAITREYQDEFGRHKRGQPFSYGSLEGFVTAKALVGALRLAGPNPTREGFVKGLYAAGGVDLGEGLRVNYAPGDHKGLSLVDLAIVTREGRFRH